MDDSKLLLIIALGLVGFGLVTVFAVLALREQLKEKSQSPAAEATVTAVVSPTPAKANPPESPRDLVSVLHLKRIRLTGELVVEVDGRQYTRAAEINDANVRRAVDLSQQDLVRWLQSSEGTSVAASIVEPPVSNPQPLTPNPLSSPVIAREPSPTAAPPTRLQIPSTNPFQQMKVLRERAKQPKTAEPKSVVEQIDEILQRRLAGSEHDARGISLRPSSAGGVQVLIGSETFDGVDSVRDEDVRAIIQAAVREWEIS